MKNADMPAMPMGQGADGRYFDANDLGDGYVEQCRPAFGLTKREYFAGLAMQGCLAMGPGCQGSPQEMAEHAVNCADALLNQLQATEK